MMSSEEPKRVDGWTVSSRPPSLAGEVDGAPMETYLDRGVISKLLRRGLPREDGLGMRDPVIYQQERTNELIYNLIDYVEDLEKRITFQGRQISALESVNRELQLLCEVITEVKDSVSDLDDRVNWLET